jgi:hypothetical protein
VFLSARPFPQSIPDCPPVAVAPFAVSLFKRSSFPLCRVRHPYSPLPAFLFPPILTSFPTLHSLAASLCRQESAQVSVWLVRRLLSSFGVVPVVLL